MKQSQSLDDSTLREDVRALVEKMLESSKQQSNQNARDKVAAVVSNSPRRHSKKYSKTDLHENSNNNWRDAGIGRASLVYLFAASLIMFLQSQVLNSDSLMIALNAPYM